MLVVGTAALGLMACGQEQPVEDLPPAAWEIAEKTLPRMVVVFMVMPEISLIVFFGEMKQEG